MKYDIIMLNMSSYSEWLGGYQNTNYHILKNLAVSEQVGKVLAVDFLPFTVKKCIKTYLKDILPANRHGRIIDRNIFSVCKQVEENIYVYSSVKAFFYKSSFIENLNELLHKLDFQNRTLISFNPMAEDLLEKLAAETKMFYTVDNWAKQSSFFKYQKKLKNNYQKIAKEVDIVVTVAEELVEFWEVLGRTENVYWIPNAVDWEQFKPQAIRKKIYFFELNNIKKPIIGYIGVIQRDRFDFDLLGYLANENPDKNFVCAGPVWKEVRQEIERKFSGLKNVFFTFQYLPREDWGAFAENFDLFINPHKKTDFCKYTNPTKIFEALALGKAVVSSRVSGLKLFGDKVYTADSYKDFNEKIRQALDEDSLAKKQERIDFIKTKHLWPQRSETILSVIKKNKETPGKLNAE